MSGLPEAIPASGDPRKVWHNSTPEATFLLYICDLLLLCIGLGLGMAK